MKHGILTLWFKKYIMKRREKHESNKAPSFNLKFNTQSCDVVYNFYARICNQSIRIDLESFLSFYHKVAD
jgi:hypothetical protein